MTTVVLDSEIGTSDVQNHDPRLCDSPPGSTSGKNDHVQEATVSFCHHYGTFEEGLMNGFGTLELQSKLENGHSCFRPKVLYRGMVRRDSYSWMVFH